MSKKSGGQYYNKSAVYPHPFSNGETVAETGARLARSSALGWPGSISIHGNLLKVNKKSVLSETDVVEAVAKAAEA